LSKRAGVPVAPSAVFRQPDALPLRVRHWNWKTLRGALALAPAPKFRRMFGLAAAPRPVAPEKCRETV
jgi:hypothetical protein